MSDDVTLPPAFADLAMAPPTLPDDDSWRDRLDARCRTELDAAAR